jgi:uroporphyrin-III C-methyltransferase
MNTSLLASLNCEGSVHLIVGSNPLAAARCGQSLGAGATPIVVAPDSADIHYALQKRIESGEVKWHKKAFEDDDVFTLGRGEVGNVVDAVFVTAGPRDPQSEHSRRAEQQSGAVRKLTTYRRTHFRTLQAESRTC